MKCECGNEVFFEKVWFIEEETKVNDGLMVRTGRWRKACDYIVCLQCGSNICVDDTFDGPWLNKLRGD